MSRSAWLGAGVAIALAATLVIFGGGAPKAAQVNFLPAASQAPAPTLAPVTHTATVQPSASSEAPSQATSSHKESK